MHLTINFCVWPEMPLCFHESSENGLDHIVNGLDIDEIKSLDVDFLDVLYVFAVVLGDDDGVDA